MATSKSAKEALGNSLDSAVALLQEGTAEESKKGRGKGTSTRGKKEKTEAEVAKAAKEKEVKDLKKDIQASFGF